MRRVRPSTPAVAAVCLLLGALPLAGCGGGSDTTAYCDALRAAQSQWTSAGASLADRGAATRFVASVRTIEVAAPDDVRGEWTTLRTFFQKFAADDPDLKGLTQQMAGYQATAKKVETHARATCGVDLSR
ncbi:hypothetical protein [Intrasporangium sp. YIM S08009]|uniref:hypothetical protein n=1 Tax=Intrasporangium zincisolvens TaxID=3080018 RepID=UPI002B05DF75|nr:hypothetical protein [Intrasporangium sp. YIM S08009]